MPITEVHRDAFRPRFRAGTPTIQISNEQQLAIREILDICCSDSRFAQKAYDALTQFILTQVPEAVAPVISSITPTTLPVASPPFSLIVAGTGFEPTTQLIWDGSPFPAVVTDATQLSAQIDLSLQPEAKSYTVKVMNNSGLQSNELTFELTAVVGLSSTNKLGKDFSRIGTTTSVMKDEEERNAFNPSVDLHHPNESGPPVRSLDEIKDKTVEELKEDQKRDDERKAFDNEVKPLDKPIATPTNPDQSFKGKEGNQPTGSVDQKVDELKKDVKDHPVHTNPAVQSDVVKSDVLTPKTDVTTPKQSWKPSFQPKTNEPEKVVEKEEGKDVRVVDEGEKK